MAAHCSVLAWRTPGTGEPGGLLSVGSQSLSLSSSSSVLLPPTWRQGLAGGGRPHAVYSITGPDLRQKGICFGWQPQADCIRSKDVPFSMTKGRGFSCF